MTPTALLTRKHLAWHTWLDEPIGLTFPTPGTPGVIYLEGPDASGDCLCQPGVTPGWLVLIGIRNRGRTSVRSADFTDLPTFTFPGRQVISAQIAAGPAARTTRPPQIRLSTPHSPDDRGTDRVELTGDFRLSPGGGCTLTFLLTGTPARYPPVQHDGALRAGKITDEPDGNWL